MVRMACQSRLMLCITSAVDSLRKVYCFRHLTYKYSKKGNTVIRVIFDWDPEKIPHAETAKEAQSQDISELKMTWRLS